MTLKLFFISDFSLGLLNLKFEKRKALKKDLNEESMIVAWHPKRWWNFSMSEDKKKEMQQVFIDLDIYAHIRRYIHT